MVTTTNYPDWLASLSPAQRQVWDAMCNSDHIECPSEIMADWTQEHGGMTWYSEFTEGECIYCPATDYRRWDELGMESVMDKGEMTFCNQEHDYGDCSRGNWYIADDDTLTIVWGSFGDDHSPGSSHYTYGIVYASKEGYRKELAEWEAKPEYFE